MAAIYLELPDVERDLPGGPDRSEGMMLPPGVKHSLSEPGVRSPVTDQSWFLAFTTLAAGHYVPSSSFGAAWKVASRVFVLSWGPLSYVLMWADTSFISLDFAWSIPAFAASTILTVAFYITAERELEAGSIATLRMGLREVPKGKVKKDVIAFLSLAVVSIGEGCTTIVSAHQPTPAAVATYGAAVAQRLVLAAFVLWQVSSFLWLVNVMDLVLRLGWWMTAATSAVGRFQSTVLSEARAVDHRRERRRRAGKGAPPPARLAERAPEAPWTTAPDGLPTAALLAPEFGDEDGQVTCDRLQAAFDEAAAIVEVMNRNFELAVTTLFVFAVCFTVLTTRLATQVTAQRERVLQALWAIIVFSAAIGVAVWTSRVGDSFVRARSQAMSPSTMLRLVRVMRKERFDAFVAGMDRAHLAFEIAHVGMTTSTVVRLIFGLVVTVGVTILHAQHEEHREHMIAHEMIHGLRELEYHASPVAHEPSGHEPPLGDAHGTARGR